MVVTAVCGARPLAEGRPPMGIVCAQQDVARVYPLPDDPERCLEDFLEVAAEHAREMADRLGRQEASVERFLELSGDDFTTGSTRLRALGCAAVRRARVLIPRRLRVFVFLGLSLLLARGLTGSGTERAEVLALVRAQARGDADGGARPAAGLPREPACAEATRERVADARAARARCRSSPTRRRRGWR